MMDTANVVMEMVVQRLDDLSKEESILRKLVWERIVPFAARRQFATYHDINEKEVTEEFLQNPFSPKCRRGTVSDLRWNIHSRNATSVIVGIYIERYYQDDAEIVVRIPTERFYASYADNALYWERTRRAELEAQTAAEADYKERLDRAQRQRAAKREAAERKKLAQLKAKYENLPAPETSEQS